MLPDQDTMTDSAIRVASASPCAFGNSAGSMVLPPLNSTRTAGNGAGQTGFLDSGPLNAHGLTDLTHDSNPLPSSLLRHYRCSHGSPPHPRPRFSRGRLPGRSFDRLRTGLEHELTLRGIPFERQKRLAVVYKDQIIGEYIADLVIDGKIIIELKAVSKLTPAHEAQAHHYLAATGLHLAILLNPSTGLRASFGAPSLEQKRIARGYEE